MTGQFTLPSKRLTILAALAIAFFAALAVSSAGTPIASAGQPPICDEYPDLPQCAEDEPGDDDREPREDAGPGGGGGAGPAGPTGDAGDGDGELPFTGYPLTSLLLLLLALLAAGLAVRSYLAARNRLRSGNRPLGG